MFHDTHFCFLISVIAGTCYKKTQIVLGGGGVKIAPSVSAAVTERTPLFLRILKYPKPIDFRVRLPALFLPTGRDKPYENKIQLCGYTSRC